MAVYYLDYNHASAADNTSTNGGSWSLPLKTLEYAVETAATADGDFIYIAHTHDEPLSADTTITAANNIQILCRNTSTNAVTTGAVIGSQSTNYALSFTGGYKIYVFGVEFRNGTGTAGNKNVIIGFTDGMHIELEACKATIAGGSTSKLAVGTTGTTINQYIKLKNFTLKLNNASQGINVNGGWVEAINFVLDPAGTAPTTLFIGVNTNAARWHCEGCDFSDVGANTLVGSFGGLGTALFTFVNCKLPTGTIYATPSTILNKGQTTVYLFNCSSGDTHYDFAHYDPFGNTVASRTYALASSAAYDGTTMVSWKVSTNGYCSLWTPYVSPWIDMYNAGGSSVTLRLEALRVGSTTAYKDTEVWGEFSVQDTSGYSLGVVYDDRYSISGSTALPIQTSSGANQADGVGYASWNAGTSSATSSDDSIKLSIAAVTPDEIGHIRARVCVAAQNVSDLYVAPYIFTS